MCQNVPREIAGQFVVRPCHLQGELYYQLANGSLVAASAEVHAEVDGIGEGCLVGPKARVGKYVLLGAFCHIAGGAKIVGNTTLEPHVVVFEQTIIEERCSIGRGCVITAWSSIGPGATLAEGTIVATGPHRALPPNFLFGSEHKEQYGPYLSKDVLDSMLALATP